MWLDETVPETADRSTRRSSRGRGRADPVAPFGELPPLMLPILFKPSQRAEREALEPRPVVFHESADIVLRDIATIGPSDNLSWRLVSALVNLTPLPTGTPSTVGCAPWNLNPPFRRSRALAGRRTWWAHLAFTPINIELTIF